MDCCAGVNAALFPAVKGTVCRRASESRFVAEGAIVAMRQSFFSLAILASIFPGPALAQFKSWSKEQQGAANFATGDRKTDAVNRRRRDRAGVNAVSDAQK